MERLSEFAALLRPYVQTVTQLDLVLEGHLPHWYNDADVSPAAAAFHIMGPICGPLSHISVSSTVYESDKPSGEAGDYHYTNVIKEVAVVCPVSVIHLVFNVQQADTPTLMLGDFDNEEPADPYELHHILLDLEAGDLLFSLKNLKHLDLGCAQVSSLSTWERFPASLTCLKLGFAWDLPSKRHLPFRLDQLAVECCTCKDLRRLLEDSDVSLQLSVRRLLIPENASEEADLTFIVNHPAWCRANSGAPHCFPVTEFWMDQDGCRLNSTEPGYRSAWEILSSLPTMPSVTKFMFEFDEDGILPLGMDLHRVQLLHTIPDAFPNLTHLILKGILSLDSDLTGLHACTSVRVMHISDSDFVTCNALLALAAALPQLLSLDVTCCDLVTADHQKTLAAYFLESRA